MNILRKCFVALTLILTLGLQVGPSVSAHGHPPRHYLGGWTRTTYYLPTGNRTASGLWPRWGMVAAPPNIPFGARVVIPGLGTFQVTDRGGAIEGNHFDVFLPWPGFRRLKDWYRGVYWTE